MSLLFMDGFGSGDISYKWDMGSQGYSALSTTPRVTGGYSANFGYGRNIYKTIPASNKVIVGFGTIHNSDNPSLTFRGDNGATTHITVVKNTSSGLLEVRRGTSSGTLLAQTSQALLSTQWHYIEVAVIISDTSGEVRVRLNGSTTDEVLYQGDTKNGGTANLIDRIQFSTGSGAGNYFRLADLYVLNNTGPAPNNNFLGDVVVRTLVPVGNGTYSQLSGSDGNSVNNYQLVDEAPFNTADYVGSATTGQKDTYNMTSLAPGVTAIYGVQMNGSMAKSDASLGQARYILRANGNDINGSVHVLSTSYVGYYDLYENNPTTGVGWTVGDVGGLEAGMEVQ